MEKIEEWVNDNNLNYGDGSGDGSGYGFGGGHGYGYGAGNGYGYETGEGYGAGRGEGGSYGFGYLDDDYGYGNGYGESLGEINNSKVYIIDGTETIIQHIRGNVAKGFILQNDFQLKPCYIAKGHGYFAHGETLKEAQKDLESKIFGDMDIDERIDNFLKEFELNKKYPASKFYEWHNKLTESCKMGRDNFIESHGIDLKSKYTVQEFIELTKNSYGADIIRELEERIKEV